MLSEKEFNALVAEFKKGTITQEGLDSLAPYRVKKAIFLAAGIGSRMKPVTNDTPKPLVIVNGVRIIDTLLDAVVAAGITDITIVRGYLAEQFDVLKEKYPTVKFVYNPEYDAANNISSAILVRDMIDNAYILEADLVLYNPDLICPYQYRTNYLGAFAQKTTDWCFESENGKITKMKLCGENCHHMFGISFWTKEDGQKLARDLLDFYQTENGKKMFWDSAALDYNAKNYSVYIRECSFNDIVEIDSFSELQMIDKSYCGKGDI